MQGYFVKILTFLIISHIANGTNEKRMLTKAISKFGTPSSIAAASGFIKNTIVSTSTDIRTDIQKSPESFLVRNNSFVLSETAIRKVAENNVISAAHEAICGTELYMRYTSTVTIPPENPTIKGGGTRYAS